MTNDDGGHDDDADDSDDDHTQDWEQQVALLQIVSCVHAQADCFSARPTPNQYHSMDLLVCLFQDQTNYSQ